ncbi:Disease resistance response protein [Parasponia andersonii]|uniref:Dirigent protein n=1 Tax=Parasponia andersonii TaxID=3476 RepID=A0A2P5DPV9_PARAD|nr:Disease resistance response protein [Parasponia andersonii]
MTKLPSIALACLILLLINQLSSGRTLGNSAQTSAHHHYHNHYKITFLMRDIFNATTHDPTTTKFTTIHDPPFSKPLGLFPPQGGVRVPLPETNPSNIPTTTGSSPQTLNLPGIVGLSFPAARATLQELEFGIVTSIEEDIYHPNFGPQVLIGKAQGIYVASSEDGSSHMMAMTASFGDGEVHGLRFFGVRKTDVNESHIAVIGGVGKYRGVNGYATVKLVEQRSGEERASPNYKLLKFSVYLSY